MKHRNLCVSASVKHRPACILSKSQFIRGIIPIDAEQKDVSNCWLFAQMVGAVCMMPGGSKGPWNHEGAMGWVRGDLVDKQRPQIWVTVPTSKCSTDSTKRLHFVAVSSRWVGDLILERGKPGFAVWFRCWAARSLVICTKGSRKTTTTAPPKNGQDKWYKRPTQPTIGVEKSIGRIHCYCWVITDGQHVRSCQQTINSTNLSFIFREASHRIPYIGTFDRVWNPIEIIKLVAHVHFSSLFYRGVTKNIQWAHQAVKLLSDQHRSAFQQVAQSTSDMLLGDLGGKDPGKWAIHFWHLDAF